MQGRNEKNKNGGNNMTPDEKKIPDENTAAEAVDDKALEDAAGGQLTRPNDFENIGLAAGNTLKLKDDRK